MKSFPRVLGEENQDRLSYNDVVGVARDTFENHGFDFTQSIDVTTDNPTLLFNISGGVKYEDVLSGDEPSPSPSSVASVQRCIRADGLDKVGYSGRHHIAFDMLGHFNFFDYDEDAAKRAAIVPAHELLDDLGIEDMFARCHPEDDTSKGIIKDLGVAIIEDEANTHTCNNKRRSGHRVELGRLVNNQPIEMWNIVFTLYEGIDESRTKLDRVAFDSGASMDRLIAAANGKASNYEAGHWRSVISEVDNQVSYTTACRAVDFARAASVLTQAGVATGSKKQGYIARKIFSELVRLEMANPSLDAKKILESVTRLHGTQADLGTLMLTYEGEAVRVERTIKLGKKAVQGRLRRAGGVLSLVDYEYLKSTHGLDEDTVDHLLNFN